MVTLSTALDMVFVPNRALLKGNLQAVKKHAAACAIDKPLVGIKWLTNHNVVWPMTNGGVKAMTF